MGLIRFILALSVLIVHSSPLFGMEIVPGYLAVQSFYVISGFYMTLIFSEKYANSARPFYYFFSNRILRLYPLYLLVVFMILALSVGYGIGLGSYGELQYFIDAYRQQPESLGSLLIVFFFNISLIGQDWITFFGIDNLGNLTFLGLRGEMQMQELLLIPIAWTVAVELFFYILTPFVVTKAKSFILYLILGVIGVRVILYLVFDVGGGFAIYRFAPTELFWFLLGVLSYKFYKARWLPPQRYGVVLLLLFMAALFSYPILKFDWLVFGCVFLCTPAIFYRFSNVKYDRYFGELAYPMYISHCFFLMIIAANRFPKTLGTGLPLVVMTLLFSMVCYHLFLKKIETFRISRIQ